MSRASGGSPEPPHEICDFAGTPLMTAYIAAGVVALLVTIYLFVALLFPERF